MRLTLPKLLEKLGIDRVLAPYETQPWVHYDSDKGQTCSAEVRMGPSARDVEAEIQIVSEDEEDEGEEGETDAGTLMIPRIPRPRQILWLRMVPAQDQLWAVMDMRLRGESYANEVYDWEGKGCAFFLAVVQAINMGDMPDIDALIAKEIEDDDGFGGGRGRARNSRKAPKIKPAQVLGVKKPM